MSLWWWILECPQINPHRNPSWPPKWLLVNHLRYFWKLLDENFLNEAITIIYPMMMNLSMSPKYQFHWNPTWAVKMAAYSLLHLRRKKWRYKMKITLIKHQSVNSYSWRILQCPWSWFPWKSKMAAKMAAIWTPWDTNWSWKTPEFLNSSI